MIPSDFGMLQGDSQHLRSGKVAKLQAWKLKRLISVFSRLAKRGHYPRDKAIRRMFKDSNIPLPSDPRHFH